MLDQIDLERAVEKQGYKQRLRELQTRLYDMQRALFESRRPALIVFEGWAGTAKIRTIGVMTGRMDPRGLRVHPITPPRTLETLYPWLYRFWLKIPSYGQIAIFDRSWYRQPIGDLAHHDISTETWRRRCEDIVTFERQLAADGAVILKFWLHISKKEQARRFRKLESDKITAWQVTDEDHWQNRHYKRVRAAVEDMVARTDAVHAPWVTIPATDERYAHIAVIETVISTLESYLGKVEEIPADKRENGFDDNGLPFRRGVTTVQTAGSAPLYHDGGREQAQVQATQTAQYEPATTTGILSHVDLSLRLDEKTYDREIATLQAKMYLLGLEIYRQQRPVVLVFEGWDASGKGGAIKRLTEKLDPRGYVVHSIAAPSGDDKVRHYLYRFWRRLPPRGATAIFDRSWYGRVLVERVEGFAREDEWQRAYGEINEFERQLVEFGTIICKFWMHVSPDEQLRRFEERQSVLYKSWKLTDEDWRNREKWPQYEQAVDDMVLRTSTPAAPWTVVEAEDKRFARIKVLQTVVQRLEAELGRIKL